METIEIIMAIVLLLTGWIASMVTYNYSKLITRGENSEKAINEMKEVDITLSNSLKLLAQEMAHIKQGQKEDHEQLKTLEHEFGIVRTQHDDLNCQRPLPRKKRIQ